MKKYFIISFMLMLLTCGNVLAAGPKNKAQRKQWYENMIQTKIDFLSRQINLTPDQKDKFEKAYRSMSNETSRLAHDTRALERQIAKKADPSDLECEKAAEAIAEFKSKEGAIELQYFNHFKTFLTKKQLFQLKIAENRWMNKLMRHRGGGKK